MFRLYWWDFIIDTPTPWCGMLTTQHYVYKNALVTYVFTARCNWYGGIITSVDRWQKILSRLAERSRALDRGLKDAKSFNDYWTDLCQWLDNSDQLLESGQISSNDADKIKTQIVKHKVVSVSGFNNFIVLYVYIRSSLFDCL